MLRTLSFVIALCGLAAVAFAQNPHPTATPEIDASSAAQAVALIGSAVMMHVSRKK